LGLTVSIMSPSMRFIFDYISSGDASNVLTQVYPDVFFYLTYGLIFFTMKKILGQQWKTRYYLILFFTDFGSNLVELMVRTGVIDIKWPMIQGILLVAIGRMALTMLTIYVMTRYTSLLMTQVHEKRYQYLMMQSARFKSEVYFLHKNMNQIEALVGLSHSIKGLSKDDEELRKLTLNLSKGVHEIKKDYLRAIRGLEEIYVGEMDINEISMKDLFQIIEENTKDYIRNDALNIDFLFKSKTSVMVKQHFYLMSILRNLINNAIEACEGQGKVSVYARETDEMVEIYVRDNGVGISEDDRSFIFNTGYSTKFNEETGDINRGIGLTLVKEMTEQLFSGEISYESELGQGTSFIVSLKKNCL